MQHNISLPIALVIPWYGDKIPGGAESEARVVAKHLNKSGVSVEVLTTCVKEFKSDWNENFHVSGISIEDGVTVRRFPVVSHDKTEFNRINEIFMAQEKPSKEEEVIFFQTMLDSPELISFISSQKENYFTFIFIPYMFQTSIDGVKAAGDKAVLIPCLHDEAYAKTDLVKEMMESVSGLIYNAKPEQTLAHELYNIPSKCKESVLGIYLSEPQTVPRSPANVSNFREKYKISAPYILYAGRKENGKNSELLAKYFIEYQEQNKLDVKLVFIGDRTPFPFQHEAIIDLGFVEPHEKYDAMAGAEFLCQPSVMESFSLVIMESWLEGRPVLVHGDCPVTKHFAKESGGGLWFETYNEFSLCLDFLLFEKQKASFLGKQGNRFVEENFSDEAMTKKYMDFLGNI